MLKYLTVVNKIIPFSIFLLFLVSVFLLSKYLDKKSEKNEKDK